MQKVCEMKTKISKLYESTRNVMRHVVSTGLVNGTYGVSKETVIKQT